ncbi:MAG: tRNA-binding protein [Proteobacteria bacterium]|nr:tRNA-binding protein [Pseudomonadota bacterium]
MASELKPPVNFEESLGLLDIRVGRVVSAEPCDETPKPTYRMVVDFGKYGRRVSYGRFTAHPPEEVLDRLVLAVLNFPPRRMGEVVSEVLVLGVQYPGRESGEATFVSPAVNAKIGSKLF